MLDVSVCLLRIPMMLAIEMPRPIADAAIRGIAGSRFVALAPSMNAHVFAYFEKGRRHLPMFTFAQTVELRGTKISVKSRRAHTPDYRLRYSTACSHRTSGDDNQQYYDFAVIPGLQASWKEASQP